VGGAANGDAEGGSAGLAVFHDCYRNGRRRRGRPHDSRRGAGATEAWLALAPRFSAWCERSGLGSFA
jgi:hypothetical protein